MATLSAKVRPEEKAAFNEVCDSIGLSPSNAIRMFVSAVNKCEGLPFLPTVYGVADQQTLESLDDSIEELEHERKLLKMSEDYRSGKLETYSIDEVGEMLGLGD